MSSAPTAPPAPRQAIGERKRRRTHATLVEAAIRVFARLGPDTPRIDDFIAEAGVARGTFYNYFETREDLLVAAAGAIADRIQAEGAALRSLADPAERIGSTVRTYIRKAATDPIRGWIIVRIALIAAPLGDAMRADLTQDIGDALAAGRIRAASPQAAHDLILGAGLMGMRAVLRGDAPESHAEDVAELLLTALGVPDATAVARRPLGR